MSETGISDLEPLKDLTALQTLDVSHTKVTNLEPLKGLTALQTLDVSYTKVADLVPVQYVLNLKYLCLLSEEEEDRFASYRKQHHLPYKEPNPWLCPK
jgi:Leucine-rich repeat (LRR) protein